MPRLDADALLELEETVTVRFETNVERILADLNRKGMLDEFLKMVGMADLISAEFDIWPRDGIIIVIVYSPFFIYSFVYLWQQKKSKNALFALFSY